MNDDMRWIMRGDNHFVWQGTKQGWVLVDGPWYQTLTRGTYFGYNYHNIYVARGYRPFALSPLVMSEPPVWNERSPDFIWERVFHRTNYLREDAIYKKVLADLMALYEVESPEAILGDPSYERLYSRRGHDLREKYTKMVYRSEARLGIGWRVWPDGRLPVLFNAVEWQAEMEKDMVLEGEW